MLHFVPLASRTHIPTRGRVNRMLGDIPRSPMKLVLALATLPFLSACSGVVEHQSYVLVPTTAGARTEIGSERALALIDSYLMTQGYRTAPIGLYTPTGFHAALRHSKPRAGAFDTYTHRDGRIAFASHYSYVPPFSGVSSEFKRVERGVRDLNFHQIGFTVQAAPLQ